MLKKTIPLSLIFSIVLSCTNDNTNIDLSNTKTGKISLNLYSPAKKSDTFNIKKFKTKSIDPTDVYYGNISVTGQGIVSPINNAFGTNPIRLPNGNENLVLNSINVPVGKNRVITVQGLNENSSSLGNHVQIKGLVDVLENNLTSATVNWNTTPSAKVIENLISASSSHVNTLNGNDIQNLVNKIINNDTPANTTDDIHPSLVNSTAISNYILNNSGNLPNPTNSTEINDYRITPQTITGKINGITYSIIGLNGTQYKHIPPTKVYCNDPSSQPFTVTDLDGNYTITGVTPGTGYTVKAEPDFHTQGISNNIASGATNVNFTVNKEHYLQHSINSGAGISHFKTTRAINVQVITPTSSSVPYTSKHRDAVTYALNAWETLAPDLIDFNVLPDIADNDSTRVTKRNDSDIYIQWTKTLGAPIGVALQNPVTTSDTVPPSYQSYSFSYSTMPFYTNLRVFVGLATHTSSNQELDEKTLKSVAMHELGHALGLALDAAGTGNPHPQTNLDDLMYPQVTMNQPTNLNIALRDLNTLKFLYLLPPNITRN